MRVIRSEIDEIFLNIKTNYIFFFIKVSVLVYIFYFLFIHTPEKKLFLQKDLRFFIIFLSVTLLFIPKRPSIPSWVNVIFSAASEDFLCKYPYVILISSTYLLYMSVVLYLTNICSRKDILLFDLIFLGFTIYISSHPCYAILISEIRLI